MRGKFVACIEAFRVECYNLPMHLLTTDDFYARLHDAGSLRGRRQLQARHPQAVAGLLPPGQREDCGQAAVAA